MLTHTAKVASCVTLSISHNDTYCGRQCLFFDFVYCKNSHSLQYSFRICSRKFNNNVLYVMGVALTCLGFFLCSCSCRLRYFVQVCLPAIGLSNSICIVSTSADLILLLTLGPHLLVFYCQRQTDNSSHAAVNQFIAMSTFV